MLRHRCSCCSEVSHLQVSKLGQIKVRGDFILNCSNIEVQYPEQSRGWFFFTPHLNTLWVLCLFLGIPFDRHSKTGAVSEEDVHILKIISTLIEMTQKIVSPKANSSLLRCWFQPYLVSFQQESQKTAKINNFPIQEIEIVACLAF